MEVRPQDLSLADLIDLILTRYHRAHAAEVAAMVTAAHHARATEHRAALGAAIARLDDELRRHMAKEETVLFPWLRSGRGARTAAPIRVMLLEHGDALAHLHEVQRLGEVAVAASPTGDPELHLATERLASFVIAHIELEDRELFPRALGG